MGETSELAEDLVDLYRAIVKITTGSKVAARDDIIARLHFMLAGQYHLTIGCMAAVWGHLTDAVRSTRIVLEVAAFAARVKRHPHLAMVWLNAAKSDDAYQEALDHARITTTTMYAHMASPKRLAELTRCLEE